MNYGMPAHNRTIDSVGCLWRYQAKNNVTVDGFAGSLGKLVDGETGPFLCVLR